MEPEQLLTLMAERRSIFPKHFSHTNVSRADVERMLEAANWAPTHKLTQPWRFVVFENEGLKVLADYQAERYKLRTTVEKFLPAKYEKLREKPQLCSHIIAVIMQRDPDQRIPEVEEISAVACAVQNMLLMATSLGIGCYWSTGGVTYDDDAHRFFDLQESDRLLGFLNIGGADKVRGKGQRSALEQKVKWISSE